MSEDLISTAESDTVLSARPEANRPDKIETLLNAISDSAALNALILKFLAASVHAKAGKSKRKTKKPHSLRVIAQ